MPEYVCKVGTPTGQVLERVYSGDTEEALRNSLADQDLLVLSIRRRFGLSLPFLGQRRRISSNEFLVFNQELAALIRAGLPILGSLDMLIERQRNPVFRQALIEIRDDVRAGASLSEAFEHQGHLFPPLYATTLASGERSGEIATVLRRYIDYTQSLAAIRRKILGASFYPAIIMAAMVIVVFVMMTFVFPNFTEFFSTMKADLPLPTVVLLGASAWMASNWVLVVGGGVAAVVAFLVWKRTPGGGRWADRNKFRVPLIGPIMHKYAVTRFTRTLGTLLAGGIPMVNSLQIASRTVGNSLFAERLEEVGRKVREGSSLWESLEETDLVSEMAVGMIKVGESSGALVEMLDNVSVFHDSQIDQRIQTLLSIMEPVLLVLIAIVVAGLLLAIYMPLISSFAGAGI